MRSSRSKKIISLALRHLLLILLALLCMFPFLWMVSGSLKDITKIFAFPPTLIPSPLVFENYTRIFEVQPNFPLYYWNSLYIAFVVTAGTVVVSSLGGYAFAKIHFPLANAIFLVLLCGMMIPTEVTAIPLFQWFTKLGMINSHLPLILPAIFASGSMFGLFLMRQHYLTVPNEICEAAKLDGCSQPRIFISLMLPMSTSAISALCIMTFLNRWNEFFEPLVYLNSSRLYTIPLALSMFADGNGTEWTLIMVASVLSTLPLLIVFFFCQKKFVDSIALSGVK